MDGGTSRVQTSEGGIRVSDLSARDPGREELKGLALVATAAILWGLLGPVARIGLREGIQPLELGFWRAALAGILCLGLARTRGLPRVGRSDGAGIVGFGLVCVALFYASYFFAVELAGAALAAILLYTAPAWVALGGFLWFGERLSPRAMVAVALTLAGVAAVSLDGGEVRGAQMAGVAWGLTAGLSYALYYLVGRRFFARYGTLNVLAYALPVGALALLPLVSFSPKSGLAWATIAFIAAVPTFAAYLIYGAGLIRVAPTRAATTAAIEPVVAAAVAFAAWNERFGVGGYIGSALVLLGVLLAARTGRRSGRTRSPTAPAGRG
jgi:drug/metabolite transporter, DME family